MKIEKIHIENFGKFTNQTFTLADGVNVFCEENGWGKSTLAAFIRIMFYGFENEGSRDELKNERKKYKPWQGGVYGGQIWFSVKEKEYVCTKIFGSKEKEDEFELRDTKTNLPVNDFGPKLGEELFSLDSASFARTVCLSQNDCCTAVTGRINAKLGNLAQNTDDINNFESVNKKLTDSINGMSPTKKTGSLKKLKESVQELKNEVRNIPVIEESIEEIYVKKQEQISRYNSLKEQKSIWQKKQKEQSFFQEIKGKKDKFVTLRDNFRVREEEYKKASEKFPGRIPTEEELMYWEKQISLLEKEKGSMEGMTFTEEEAGKYETLCNRFSVYHPSEQEIDAYSKKAKSLGELQVKIAKSSMSESDREKLRRYREKYSDGIPSGAEIGSLIGLWGERTEKKNSLSQKKIAYRTLCSIAGKEREEAVAATLKGGNRLVLVGALILLAAVLCAIFFGRAVCYVLGLPGIVMLIYGMKKRTSAGYTEEIKSDEQTALEEEIEADEEYIADAEQKIVDFFARVKIPYEESLVLQQLFEIRADIQEYAELRELEGKDAGGDYRREYLRIKAEIADFLKQFFGLCEEEEKYREMLYDLQKQKEEYELLGNKKQQYEKAKKNCSLLKEQMNGFLADIGMPKEEDVSGLIGNLRSHLVVYDNCKKEYLTAKREKEDFEKQNEDAEALLSYEEPDITQSLTEIEEMLSSIGEELEEIHKNILDYSRQAEEKTQQLERLAETEKELEEKTEEFARKEKTYQILTQTKKYLEEAKTSFTNRYTEPLLRGFGKYYTGIVSKEASDYVLDANISMTVEELGKQRKPESLSAGRQDLIGICMRMALIEAMYEEEKPFLMLDDPFVNLDREKTENALQVLNEIGTDYQVLYFTCHDSRVAKDAVNS